MLTIITARRGLACVAYPCTEAMRRPEFWDRHGGINSHVFFCFRRVFNTNLPNLGDRRLKHCIMKLRAFFSVLIFFITNGLQAQDLKIMVNEKGKVGFADSQGNEVIKCKYDGAYPFENGYAIVGKSDKYGIIDASGEIVLPLKYDKISKWNDLYLIKNGKDLGLASTSGEIVLKPDYTVITPTNCYGKALIAKGGKAAQMDKKTYMRDAKYGVIDSKGNILIPAEYKGLWEFSADGKDFPMCHEGYGPNYVPHYVNDTLVTDCSYLCYGKVGYFPLEGKHLASGGLMDGNGKILIKEGTYTFVMKPQNNMVRTYKTKVSKKSTEIASGYYDLSNEKAFNAANFTLAPNEIPNWTHGDFVGSIAPVNSPTVWSFIDKSGQVLRTGYTAIAHSPYTHIWVAKKESGIYDVFDEDNNDITALSGSFTDMGFPTQKGDKEIYNVLKDGKWGAVNRSGSVIVPFGEYDGIGFNNYDFMVVKKDKKFGMINANGEKVVPLEYEDIAIATERNAKEFWVKKADSLFYHYNINKAQESAKGYKYVTNYKDGIALVTPYGFTPADNLINKCLFFTPYTPLATISALKPSEKVGHYGILIDENDNVLFDQAMTVGIYQDRVRAYMKAHGNKALTKTETKNLLLEITNENRSYPIDEEISEDEWNY